eukprot:UN14387
MSWFLALFLLDVKKRTFYFSEKKVLFSTNFC